MICNDDLNWPNAPDLEGQRDQLTSQPPDVSDQRTDLLGTCSSAPSKEKRRSYPSYLPDGCG